MLLKKVNYDLKKPATYAGKSKLLQEATKHHPNISIEDAEKWLKSKLAYALHKLIRLNFKARSVEIHQIDQQWWIDLVDTIKKNFKVWQWIQV